MDLSKFIRANQPREAYKHSAQLARAPETVTRKGYKPYTAGTITSNARWFPAETENGPRLVASTQFDPKELGELCAALVEAKVDRLEISVFDDPTREPAEKPAQ